MQAQQAAPAEETKGGRSPRVLKQLSNSCFAEALSLYSNKCVRKICRKLSMCSANRPGFILLLGSVPTKTEEPVQQEPRQPPMTRKECLEVVPVPEKCQATKIR